MIAFTIEDMTCGHCVATITRALTELDPLARVHADLPAKEVRVESMASADRLQRAIEDAGYAPVAKAI